MTREEVWELTGDQLDYELQVTLRGLYVDPINYTGDLNALQEAEATLAPEQWAEYMVVLLEMMPTTPEICESVAKKGNLLSAYLHGMWLALTAPARLRAEALLLTLLGSNCEQLKATESN